MGKIENDIQVIATIIPCGLFIVDKGGCITSWNEAAAGITGIQASKALGSKCRHLLQCRQDCPMQGGGADMPLRGRAVSWKTGTRYVDVLSSLQYLRDEKGEPVGMIESFMPVAQGSDFRCRSFSRSQAVDEVSNTTAFIADLGRELQTPLNGIYGLAEMLASSESEKTQSQILVLLKRSAKMLMNLTEEILLLREIENGNFRPGAVSFDLNELIDSVIERQRRTWSGNQARIDKWIASDVPCCLQGDSRRLARVLERLLDNALQSSPQASVELRVAVLQFKSESDDCQASRLPTVVLEFAIEDHGPGLKQAELDLIFRDFKEVDPHYAKSTRFLGLLLSRFLVKNMGGRMWIESGLSGTVVNFTLPLKMISLHSDTVPSHAAGKDRAVDAA